MNIGGMATAGGTRAYTKRFPDLPDAHWREAFGLTLSSIGMGTYLGQMTPEADRAYADAVSEALTMGCNVLDTAVNYRAQRSERSIGRALRTLVEEGKLSREEVVLCTKGGFLPFDGEAPSDAAAYFQSTFVDRGLMKSSEIVAGCHCISPDYIADQIYASLRNLGVDALDVYYLHNPETQLSEVSQDEFFGRLEAAFKVLETAVAEKKIRVYGLATWDAFRADPSGPKAKSHIPLERVVETARKAGGDDHHLRVIQLPLNLAMLEAHVAPTQPVGGGPLPALKAAQELGLTVFTSVPLLQTRLLTAIPEKVHALFPGLQTNAQRAIQFARSTPGVTAPLVGMSKIDHVRENLHAASVEPLSSKQLELLFQ